MGAVGNMVCQKDASGKFILISCSGKGTTPAQRNWPIHEIECFSLVHCLKENATLLANKDITVYSDSLSTSYLQTIKSTTGRLFRFSLLLQDFKFRLSHIPGKRNPSDLISRSSAFPPPTRRIFRPPSQRSCL